MLIVTPPAGPQWNRLAAEYESSLFFVVLLPAVKVGTKNYFNDNNYHYYKHLSSNNFMKYLLSHNNSALNFFSLHEKNNLKLI